jgi:hypothetical protein
LTQNGGWSMLSSFSVIEIGGEMVEEDEANVDAEAAPPLAFCVLSDELLLLVFSTDLLFVADDSDTVISSKAVI